MEVSVIIVNYNTFNLTCNCIRSIIQQTVHISFEIIVVDNGSAERDANDFKIIFPSVKLVKSSNNRGFASGNNLGIEVAEGDAVLLLNSDTLLSNNAIYICYQFLKKNPKIGVVTGRLEFPDGRIQHNCQRFPSIKYKLFELLRLQRVFGNLAGKTLLGFFFDYKTIIYPDWIWGTFFMFSKNILLQFPNKKLPENFFMYVEDMQWCKEFRRHGYKIAFQPDARIVHLMGGSAGEKGRLMNQNLEVFMGFYYPAWKRIAVKILNFLLTGVYGY